MIDRSICRSALTPNGRRINSQTSTERGSSVSAEKIDVQKFNKDENHV